MKAEDILNDNLPFGDSTYMGECKQEVLNAMEEYHQSQLQALKEEVEKRISNCEKFMARSNSVNASIYNNKIDAFEEVLNLITNLTFDED